MIIEFFRVKEDGEMVGKLRRRPVQRTELLEGEWEPVDIHRGGGTGRRRSYRNRSGLITESIAQLQKTGASRRLIGYVDTTYQ